MYCNIDTEKCLQYYLCQVSSTLLYTDNFFNNLIKLTRSFLSVIVSVERPVIMTSNTYFRMTELLRVRSPTHPCQSESQGRGGVNIGQLKVLAMPRVETRGPKMKRKVNKDVKPRSAPTSTSCIHRYPWEQWAVVMSQKLAAGPCVHDVTIGHQLLILK